MSSFFTFEGVSYPYFPSGHERTVEVPIVMGTVRRHLPLGSRILEVGRVLPRYYKFKGTVVDKFEGPIKEDILTYTPSKPFNLIISISTVEHIWWDEAAYGGKIPRTPGKAAEAVKRMLTMLTPGGEMLCTWPIGYNPPLDQALFKGAFPEAHVGFLKRITLDNKWIEVSRTDAVRAKYKKPFPAGNVVVIARWRT